MKSVILFRPQSVKKTENVLDDIVVFDNQIFFDEVDLVFRGYAPYFDNANEKLKNLSKKKNIFLVNFTLLKNRYLPENQNYFFPEQGEKHRELFTPDFHATHIVSGHEALICISKNIPFVYLQNYVWKDNKLIKGGANRKADNIQDEIILNHIKNNKKCKLIKFYFRSTRNFRSGTGIYAALVMSKISKKINIHGWNFFMEASPQNLSYWEALNLFSPIKYEMYNPSLFERMVVHCLYANRLKELKHVHVHGYLNDFVIHHPILAKKCEEIFYKNV